MSKDTQPISHAAAMSLARAAHRISYEDAGIVGLYWSCSCGTSAARRLVPPTGPMARAAADRHVDAAARKIRAEVSR